MRQLRATWELEKEQQQQESVDEPSARLALASQLIEEPKAELLAKKLNIAERCRLPLEEVERLFGEKPVSLWKRRGARNAWSQFLTESYQEDHSKLRGETCF